MKITKHVIIAGTPRSGKTTLSLMLSEIGLTHYKMDTIKRAICAIYNLDQHDWISHSKEMATLIEYIIKENASDTTNGIEYYALDTPHLFPKDIKHLNESALIIFLGYKDITSNEKLKEIRKYDQKNYWSSQVPNFELIKMLGDNIMLSKYFYKECQKNNVIYFDVSYNRNEVLENVYNFIISNITNIEKEDNDDILFILFFM